MFCLELVVACIVGPQNGASQVKKHANPAVRYITTNRPRVNSQYLVFAAREFVRIRDNEAAGLRTTTTAATTTTIARFR